MSTSRQAGMKVSGAGWLALPSCGGPMGIPADFAIATGPKERLLTWFAKETGVLDFVFGPMTLPQLYCSAASVRRKMPYFALMFLVAALLTCIGCDRTTPAETFQTATRKPMPSSVRIFNSRSRAVTAVDHYVHFTISPEDLAAIVQGAGYKKDEKPSLDFHLWKGRPAWWTPEKLGSGAVEFTHTPDEQGDAWRRRLFVNSTSTEVYCYAAPD